MFLHKKIFHQSLNVSNSFFCLIKLSKVIGKINKCISVISDV